MDLIATLIEADKLGAKDRHQEARYLLVQLALKYPTNPVVQYKTACAHDFLGLEEKIRVEAYSGETISALQMFRDFYDREKSEETLRRHLNAPTAIRAHIDPEKKLS